MLSFLSPLWYLAACVSLPETKKKTKKTCEQQRAAACSQPEYLNTHKKRTNDGEFTLCGQWEKGGKVLNAGTQND